jgi:hypothetical protein
MATYRLMRRGAVGLCVIEIRRKYMATHLFESLPMMLGPGQTKSILQGTPAFLSDFTFNGITVTVRPVPPALQVILEATYVARDGGGNLRVGYVVRNTDPNTAVEFKRTTVSIDQF